MSAENQEQIITAWLDKAADSLREAELLLRAEHAQGTINRLYYACFQGVTALLIRDGISSKSHKGVKAKFGEHYVRTGRVTVKHNATLTELFKLRLQADYAADADFDLADAQRLLESTREFLVTIRSLIEEA